MEIQVTKVGIISCSGEEKPGGTLCRFAGRKVLDELRRDSTVTFRPNAQMFTYRDYYTTVSVDRGEIDPDCDAVGSPGQDSEPRPIAAPDEPRRRGPQGLAGSRRAGGDDIRWPVRVPVRPVARARGVAGIARGVGSVRG